MHVVFFLDFHDSTLGGVQTSVRAQRKGLERAGHQVTIVCPPALTDTPIDPSVIITHDAPFAPNGFPMTIPSRLREHLITKALLQRPPIDIIHVQTNMGVGMMGVRIAKRLGIPLVQTMHGRDDVLAERTFPMARVTMGLLALGHRLFIPHTTQVDKQAHSPTAYSAWQIMLNHAQAADHVVMPSQHFVDKFKARGLTRPVSVVSNGLDDDMLASLTLSTRRYRSGEPLRVMWCGRVSPEKRPLVAIEALGHIEGVELDIYGAGSEVATIKQCVKKHKLGKRVHLKGRASQTKIIEAMSDHDVLLYTSYGFDNQPMVLLEATSWYR
jgi:glycosyltransferase involved in cell wall biosynthesis